MALNPFKSVADQELIGDITKIAKNSVAFLGIASMAHNVTNDDLVKLFECSMVDAVNAYIEIMKKRSDKAAAN